MALYTQPINAIRGIQGSSLAALADETFQNSLSVIRSLNDTIRTQRKLKALGLFNDHIDSGQIIRSLQQMLKNR